MFDLLDPSSYGVSADPSYTFTMPSDGTSVGPQSDGTYNIPSIGQTISTGQGQAGNAPVIDSSIANLLSQGIGAFTKIYTNGQLLDYNQYQATQAGLVAQGQNASNVATAQLNAAASNRMIMILGIFAVIALAIHKG